MSEPEPNLNLENGAQVNLNRKIFWAEAKPEPEPLFETVRHPDSNTVSNGEISTLFTKVNYSSFLDIGSGYNRHYQA